MLLLLSLLLLVQFSSAAEFTFELKENEEQCFFDEIEEGENAVIEFQVILLTKCNRTHHIDRYVFS